MALFLNRNFMNMKEAELANTRVHFGTVEVSSRVFESIVGRRMNHLREMSLLQDILDGAINGDDGLDFPFDGLLELEFGHDIVKVAELPDDVLAYLQNTPHDVVMIDFYQAVKNIREAFEHQKAQPK